MSDSLHCLDDLKSALAAGDEGAFRTLLDAVGPRMRRAAIRMLGSQPDADDVVQEVFVSIVKSRHRLVRVDDLNAYLFASMHRAIARSLKRRRRRPTPVESLEDVPQESASCFTSFDEELLDRAIQRLPEKQREVVVLKTDAQMTFASIAELLGVGASTVASRYRYALEKLRTELRREEC